MVITSHYVFDLALTTSSNFCLIGL